MYFDMGTIFFEMDDQSMLEAANIFSCGELITEDQSFMRGHGTYLKGDKLYSSVSGVLDRVNKLVSVKALRCRYSGDIGDVVIGRILEIGGKRWKVDVNSRQDAALLLSSIHLPGAIQRRKSESDELQMRNFYREGEIICAEVQSIFHDGGLGVHTRNLKYGKLVTGELICVQTGLIKRSRSHFHVFEWGVEVILGVNGFVWAGKPRKSPDEQDLDAIYSSALDSVDLTLRQAIARTRNCIQAMNGAFIAIDEEGIRRVYEASLKVTIAEILQDNFSTSIKTLF